MNISFLGSFLIKSDENDKQGKRFSQKPSVNGDYRNINSTAKSINSEAYKANYTPFLEERQKESDRLEKLIAPHLMDAKNEDNNARNKILEISYDWIDSRSKKLSGKYNNKISPEEIASDAYMLILDGNIFKYTEHMEKGFLGYLYKSMENKTIKLVNKLKKDSEKCISLSTPYGHDKGKGQSTIQDIIMNNNQNIEKQTLDEICIENIFKYLSEKLDKDEIKLLKSFYINDSDSDYNPNISDSLISIFNKLDIENKDEMPKSLNLLSKKINEQKLDNYLKHLDKSAKGFVKIYNQLSKDKGTNLEFNEFQRELKTRIDNRHEINCISKEDKNMLELMLGLGSDKKWRSQIEVARLFMNIPPRTVSERINNAVEKIEKTDIENYLNHLNVSARGLVDLYNQLSKEKGYNLELEEFQKELKTRIDSRYQENLVSKEDKKMLELILGLGNDKKWLSQYEVSQAAELNVSETQVNRHMKNVIEVIKKSDIENYLDHLNKASTASVELYNQLLEKTGRELTLDEFKIEMQNRIDEASERNINPLTSKEKEAIEMLFCLGKNHKCLNQTQIALKMNVDSATVNNFVSKAVKRLNCSDMENYFGHLNNSAKGFVGLYNQLSKEKGYNLELEEFQKELKIRIDNRYETNCISKEDKDIFELMLGLGNDKKWWNQSDAVKLLGLKGNFTGINNRINKAIEVVKKSDIENYLNHLSKSARGFVGLYNQLSKEKGYNLELEEFQKELKTRIDQKHKEKIISDGDKELLELILGLGKNKKWLKQPETIEFITSNISNSSSSIGRRVDIAIKKLIA
ncbi:MAG: hypothetical protein PHV68_01095 [Candidatus Gastranaerophilales bacterium]|nr:hypothetical protein [Candidatus Gastranaerophilales bacterium]